MSILRSALAVIAAAAILLLMQVSCTRQRHVFMDRKDLHALQELHTTPPANAAASEPIQAPSPARTDTQALPDPATERIANPSHQAKPRPAGSGPSQVILPEQEPEAHSSISVIKSRHIRTSAHSAINIPIITIILGVLLVITGMIFLIHFFFTGVSTSLITGLIIFGVGAILFLVSLNILIMVGLA